MIRRRTSPICPPDGSSSETAWSTASRVLFPPTHVDARVRGGDARAGVSRGIDGMTTAMDKENFNWDGFGQVRASPRLDSGFPLDAPRDSAPRAGSASHPLPSNPSPLRRSRS